MSSVTLPDFLHQSGRKLHPVKGDGNCMFRCFSHHLLGNEEEHDAVRTLIIRFENFNRHYFEPLLMSNNEPTLKAHVSKMCRPFTWGTQVEIQAVTCLFRVPVYECVQSQDGETYHWEVHHPRAPADQFRLPPIVEDDPVYSAVIPHHFELAYTRNCHYDCIVDKESGELVTTPPEIPVQHFYINLT